MKLLIHLIFLLGSWPFVKMCEVRSSTTFVFCRFLYLVYCDSLAKYKRRYFAVQFFLTWLNSYTCTLLIFVNRWVIKFYKHCLKQLPSLIGHYGVSAILHFFDNTASLTRPQLTLMLRRNIIRDQVPIHTEFITELYLGEYNSTYTWDSGSNPNRDNLYIFLIILKFWHILHG